MYNQQLDALTNSEGTILFGSGVFIPAKDLTCQTIPIYNPVTKRVRYAVCGRRACPNCSWLWASKWRYLLRTNADVHGNIPQRALTLTFACKPTLKQFRLAMQYFWQCLKRYSPKDPKTRKPKQVLNPATGRKRLYRPYDRPAYFGVVEFNRKQTIPHIHLLLTDSDYIPRFVLQKCWQKAQTMAGLVKIAWNVDVRAIRDKEHLGRYITKYVTKTGHSDKGETPPTSWGGRGIRYSKDFFGTRLQGLPKSQRSVSASAMWIAHVTQIRAAQLGFFRPLFDLNNGISNADLTLELNQSFWDDLTISRLGDGRLLFCNEAALRYLGCTIDVIDEFGNMRNVQCLDVGWLT
jgi:hypothetical protein